MSGLPLFDNHDSRIQYYDLLLERPLTDLPHYELPQGYHFTYYQDGDRDAWIAIEQSAKEFQNEAQGLEAWERYYLGRENELPDRMVFIVTDSGEKVATATAFYNIYAEDPPGTGWLHWVAVKRSYQGKGLSKPLLSHTFEIMKTLGYTHAKIHTQTTTWLACKIYLDFGFQPIPQNAVQNAAGWRIIKYLTGHPVLDTFPCASEDEVLSSGL